MQDPSNPSMTREQLSQLMDGEWHELNPSDCVRGICNDDDMRDTWARYHLIRDAINGEPLRTDTALVSRICDAIADEPAYSNITPIGTAMSGQEAEMAQARSDLAITGSAEPADSALAEDRKTGSASSGSSWFGTGMAGFALAASVAAVTVVGMNVWRDQLPQTSDSAPAVALKDVQPVQNRPVTQSVTGVTVPRVDLVANTGLYWTSTESDERVGMGEEKLNMMFSHHIESSPTSALEGALKYSRLVGYDERQESR